MCQVYALVCIVAQCFFLKEDGPPGLNLEHQTKWTEFERN